MRKLFISADMEGCASVAARNGLAPERWAWEWSAARRWMTEEVKAVAEAAIEAGIEEVIVADSHHNAHNIEPDILPDNVKLVRSWPRPFIHMQGVEDPDVEACAFIGYHAMASSQGGLLAHTYHGGAFRSIRLNGEYCSEGYLNAALAGEFDLPVVFISGDQATVEDSLRYARSGAGFVTKHAIGWQSQASLPPAQVRRLLRSAFSEQLVRPLPQPFRVAGPFRLELEMTTQITAEMLSYLPIIKRVDAFTVSAIFGSVQDCVRLVSFAMLYTPVGAAL